MDTVAKFRVETDSAWAQLMEVHVLLVPPTKAPVKPFESIFRRKRNFDALPPWCHCEPLTVSCPPGPPGPPGPRGVPGERFFSKNSHKKALKTALFRATWSPWSTREGRHHSLRADPLPFSSKSMHSVSSWTARTAGTRRCTWGSRHHWRPWTARSERRRRKAGS